MVGMSRLKEARDRKNLTQEQLANLVGLSTMTISRYERGERQPKSGDLQKLAEALGVTVAYLMGEDDDANLHLEKSDELHRIIVGVDVINVPIVDPKITACAGEGNGYYGVEWNIVATRPIPTNQLMGHLWQGVQLKIMRVEGSSMEPKYRSGDSVLLAEGEDVRNGDIILVVWDDRLYIRGYFVEGAEIVLKPRNPIAGEIRIDKEDSRLQILGKVIAKVPDLEFESGFYS